MNTINVLFVCSKNRWRSPTAERMYRRDRRFNVRSAGTARSAAHTVTERDIAWADAILAMEQKHSQRIRSDFRAAVSYTPIHVLDIPDNYQFMDPELITILEAAVESLFPAP